MQLAFPRISLRQRLLAGAALLVLATGTLALRCFPSSELFLLSRPSVCLLKTVTGVPCLACRGTRAAIALSHGHAARALRFNPLATLFVAGFAGGLALISLSGKACQVRLSRPESVLFWTLLVFALLGNWIYVIRQGG